MAKSPRFINRIFALCGSLLLLRGVFLPVVHVPVRGTLTYIQAVKPQAIVLLILVALSVYVSLRNKWRALLLCATGMLAVFVWTYCSFQSQISNARYKYLGKLGKSFLGDIVTDTVKNKLRFEWGMWLLILGVVLILIAAISEAKRKTR